uniref:Sushi domain-containing protein n=1 Tax=Timema cristinae TaxID=61476 RepID=A0A7R9CPX5_TIMCR|nr:unnamed protein product [Timema cristinae]
MALAIIFMIIWGTKEKATARHEESHSRGCRNQGLADQWTNDELRCGNVTERQTSHDMSSDANYNGLYLTIPPPLGFSGPESPPPSYEVAHVFDKPVQTPPPSYSAAVDLSGQPIWDHSYLPSQQHTPHWVPLSLSYYIPIPPPSGVPQDLSNLVEVGLNPSENQVRCRRGTRDWSGPKPTCLEQGLASLG